MKQTSKQTPEDRFKFRVYSQRLKRYIEQSPCIGLDGMVMDIHTLEKNHIIEQCTGVHDKNKTLIFEGDIVLHTDITRNSNVYSVIYHHGICSFMLERYDTCSELTTIGLYACDTNNIEIIGNIHDNEEGNKDV